MAGPADTPDWWKPWKRAFWTIDVVFATTGIGITVVATLLVFFLSSHYDAQIRAKADEAHDLNAALIDNGRALFDVATTFAIQRTLEAHTDASSDDATRRAITREALTVASRSFVAYLKATAPQEIAGFEAQSARIAADYAAGDDAGPLKLRALTSTLMDGPSAEGNRVKGERRISVVGELAALRRERDLYRAIGGFLQVFGIIFAVAGQVAGRKHRTWLHAPPEIKALPAHILTRRFWTMDVVGIAFGTAVTMTGTAVLFFAVDARQRDIDEARRQLDGRETLVALSEAAFNDYDEMSILEPFVRDIVARRTPESHLPPPVKADRKPGDDVTAIEIEPAEYVTVRKSYPVYWLVRMLHDNDPGRYAADVERFYALVEDTASPAYRALEADTLARAHARMATLKAERDALADALGAAERAQAETRDWGTLLMLIGLLLSFAGNVTYYKRPRR